MFDRRHCLANLAALSAMASASIMFAATVRPSEGNAATRCCCACCDICPPGCCERCTPADCNECCNDATASCCPPPAGNDT